MASAFRVVTTPTFEREFRKVSRGNAALIDALGELVATLCENLPQPKCPAANQEIGRLETWRRPMVYPPARISASRETLKEREARCFAAWSQGPDRTSQVGGQQSPRRQKDTSRPNPWKPGAGAEKTRGNEAQAWKVLPQLRCGHLRAIDRRLPMRRLGSELHLRP